MFEGKFLNFFIRLKYTKVAICEYFSIDAQPMQIEKLNSDEIIDVPIPSAHDGPSDVKCLLISKTVRRGMVRSDNCF